MMNVVGRKVWLAEENRSDVHTRKDVGEDEAERGANEKQKGRA